MTGSTAVFHPGRQHSWQTVLALQEAASLQWFATALLYQRERWPYRLENLLPGPLRGKVQRYFQKISNAEIDQRAVRILGAYEWAERLAAKAGWLRTADFVNRAGNVKFQRGVISLLQREPAPRIWGYDTSCADVFEVARREGIVCVLDRSIGHPRDLRQILERERAQFPQFFAGNIGVPSHAAIAQADREIAYADHVVTGSRFCADTVLRSGIDPGKVHIVPYGYDETLFSDRRALRPGLGNLPVRFLFVGTVSPRKGVHYLFEAFSRIPKQHATLAVAGPLAMPREMMARYADRIDYLGPLSRAEVVEQFEQAHCFIFPSLFEGGGIVLYEAIAAGLGLIHSQATGDGVRSDGANGIKLETVSTETIFAAVQLVLQQPQILRAWADASWSMRQDNSWQVYRRRTADLLPSLTKAVGA